MQTEESREEWAPLMGTVDESRFDRGRIGPYVIGSSLRATALGEVVLAISEGFPYVVEVDLFDALANTHHTSPEGTLMVDLAQASIVEHPHVAKIVGAGLENGVPYVVRRHRLGRTLAQVLERGGPLPPNVAVGVLSTLAATLGDLSERGPHPGAWSLGGFDARDIFIRFDGEVSLHGLGLQRVRLGTEEPECRDLMSWSALGRRIIDTSGDSSGDAQELAAVVGMAKDLPDALRGVRKVRMKGEIAHRIERLASVMRDRFEDAIREERAYFELAPLQ